MNSNITEMLFNALNAIETLSSGTIKVCGLSSDQDMDRRIDTVHDCGSSHTMPAFQDSP